MKIKIKYSYNYNHSSLLDGVETLPQLLKTNRYKTGLLGKRHVGPDSKFPFDLEISHKELKKGGSTKKILSIKKCMKWTTIS